MLHFSYVYVHSNDLPLTAPKTHDRHLGDPQCLNHQRAGDAKGFRIHTPAKLVYKYLQGVPLIIIERHGEVQSAVAGSRSKVDLEQYSEIFCPSS